MDGFVARGTGRGLRRAEEAATRDGSPQGDAAIRRVPHPDVGRVTDGCLSGGENGGERGNCQHVSQEFLLNLSKGQRERDKAKWISESGTVFPEEVPPPPPTNSRHFFQTPVTRSSQPLSLIDQAPDQVQEARWLFPLSSPSFASLCLPKTLFKLREKRKRERMRLIMCVCVRAEETGVKVRVFFGYDGFFVYLVRDVCVCESGLCVFEFCCAFHI